MIERWNRKVKNDDEVYVLGDFSWERGPKTWDILSRLHGKIRLVEGNHDSWYLDDMDFDDSILESVTSYDESKEDDKRTCILSHYPIPFYNHQFSEGTYMLYGHVHNTYDEYLINRFLNDAGKLERDSASGDTKTTPFHMINVFALFSDYVPLTLNEWIELDKKRRDFINSFGEMDYDAWMELNKQVVQKSKEGWK